MFWLRACPRCNGDVFLEEDTDGYYVVCLQCGYLFEVQRQASVKEIARALKSRYEEVKAL